MSNDNVPKLPPPVEPMSDVAWARVERGLMSRLDAPARPAPLPVRRRAWWLAVPALVAAAAIALVVVLRGGGSPEPDQPAFEPSRVVAGEAPSAVSFGDAHIALEARTAIVMSYEGGSPSVLVENGASTFTVAPRHDRPPFVVRAADVVVRVVGTQFKVGRADERITVAVDHGIVDVIFRGNTVRVGAGQGWASDHPEAVTVIAQNAPTNLPMATTTEPPATTTTEPPATTPRPPRTDAPRTQPPTTDELRAKYDRAVGLEVRDSNAAIALYLDVAKGQGAWAAVALYSAGRLAADRGDKRAATFLTAYLRRFPAGANAADARALLDRLQGAPK